jgi:mRNA interferase RelE/StbE
VYKIELRRTAQKNLKEIPVEHVRLIVKHIDLLEQNPRPADSKKLEGDAGYSLRIGTYRVLYDIDDKLQIVTIYRIKHRRDVYR